MNRLLSIPFVLAALSVAPGSALADDARFIVLPAAGDVVADPPAGRAITQAVLDGLEQAGREARRHATDCDRIECAEALVESEGVDAAVLVRAFRRNGEVYEVTLVVVRASGRHGNGRHPVPRADTLRPAVQTALAQALVDSGTASVRWTVNVVTEPAEAFVTIDGEPMPLGGLRVHGGEHTVAVNHEGYIEHLETIHVDADTTLRVTLEADPDAAHASLDSDPEVTDGPRPGRVHRIVGGVLVGLGAAGIAATIGATVSDLDCADSRPDGCAEGREIAPGPFAGWMALSALAAIGGVVLIVIAPDEPQAPTASLRFSPTGARFRLDF